MRKNPADGTESDKTILFTCGAFSGPDGISSSGFAGVGACETAPIYRKKSGECDDLYFISFGSLISFRNPGLSNLYLASASPIC